MHKLKLDDHAQRKIKDYITHMFNTRRIMAKEQNFLKQLPEPLAVEVRFAEALRYVSKLKVLADISRDAMRQICLQAVGHLCPEWLSCWPEVRQELLPEHTLCLRPPVSLHPHAIFTHFRRISCSEHGKLEVCGGRRSACGLDCDLRTRRGRWEPLSLV